MDSRQASVPTGQLSRAFASTRAVLEQVEPGQLDAATPCASWDVRALISHFIGSARWAAVMMSGEGEQAGPDDELGDYLARYDDCVKAALAAFEADGALGRTVQLEFGEFPGAALLSIAATDQFMHGWDLARALGLDADLDPGLAGELLSQARVAVPDSFRGPDGAAPFGPIVEARAGACPADQLAAFLGRAT
jgi:uncharacterized protein (TIGR03086 family)